MQLVPVDAIFFAAHPDDTELSAGGTVAKFVRDGRAVGMVDLTRGEMGTRGTAATRKREAANSAKILGASFREQLDFGDGALRTGRDEELQIIEILRVCKPRLVFVSYPDERHPDHERAGRVVTDASFYAGLRALDTGRPAHRPQAVVYYLQNYPIPPTFVVDVTATWKTKTRAIAAFKSQFHDPKSKEPATVLSDPKFLEMINARGKHYGALIGAKYGEAFVTKQPPKVSDVIAAYDGREIA
ncbi:MAG TPA: bacillithiol biosynthesis deacetylase BshB1 [Thermoanaerobaculia bacterium]|nr:bacillithiol biosynthesis deacetylase BshB1 [Thermoanaerobaculia bacterium]